jgi:uncharacterized membrane protein YdjX (TVP38/TMEM64 family)
MLRDLAAYFAVMAVSMSVLSLPLAPATLIVAQKVAPWAVALTASAAGAAASTFDHWFVRRAFKLRMLEQLRAGRWFCKAEGWARVAPFWTTVLFAAVPLPFTVVRVLMPLSGYPMWKYVAAVALGRLPRIFVIATFGSFVRVPIPILVAIFAVTVGVGLTAAIIRRIKGRGPRAEADAPHC